MEFKEWLLTENNIKFAGWIKDGTIIVYIDSKRYVYDIDPIFHPEISKIAKYRPFAALNKIKKLIKYNKGKQLEPIEPSPVRTFTQPTLF